MSDAISHIDIDSDDFLDAPKALRDYAKKLQQANTRLSEQNQTLTGQVTASALGDVLKPFKNPERVKRDLLSDKIDPLNSEAVKSWLETNGDDYARGAATAPVHQDSAHAEDAANQARLNSTTEFRQDASMSKLEAAMAEISPEMTGPQIAAIYAKHGV